MIGDATTRHTFGSKASPSVCSSVRLSTRLSVRPSILWKWALDWSARIIIISGFVEGVKMGAWFLNVEAKAKFAEMVPQKKSDNITFLCCGLVLRFSW